MDNRVQYYVYHIATNRDISEYLSQSDLRQDELPGPTRIRTPQLVGRGAAGGYSEHRRAIGDANESIEGYDVTTDRIVRYLDDTLEYHNAETEEDRSETSSRNTIREPPNVDNCNVPEGGENRRQTHRRTPWKVIAFHTGTKRDHYHLLYISTNKNWGNNSKLGKIIKSDQFMCRKVTCIPHILEYISTGTGRKTLRNVLTTKDKRIIKCAACQLGIPIGQNTRNAGNTEGGASIFCEQGTTQNKTDTRMVTGSPETNQDIPEMEIGTPMGSPQGIMDATVQPSGSGNRRLAVPKRSHRIDEQNGQLVLLLCDNRAFNEGDAQRVLCQSPEGITIQFIKNFAERLRTAISISRILVFCESVEKRLERAKQHYLRLNPEANHPIEIENSYDKLRQLIVLNNIYPYGFAMQTKRHFYQQTNKRNNLFFYGPPSTGKTMVMESLVRMHYNFERLTGLTPGSSFNFSSLLHTNACFMDECKLTENQFEQWKLLAAGSPMCTDVKYKNRHNVENCVLYTASNYSIGQYLMIPDVDDAIKTRTIEFRFNHLPVTYFKISPWTWERFWEKELDNDLDECA